MSPYYSSRVGVPNPLDFLSDDLMKVVPTSCIVNEYCITHGHVVPSLVRLSFSSDKYLECVVVGL